MLWTALGIAALAAAAAGVAVAVQAARFERRVVGEARQLWGAGRTGVAGRRSLEGLPAPVRRYMEVSGAAARDPVRSVRLRHGGTLRPALDRPWSPIRGVQYFGVDPPGFVWLGRIRLAPGLSIVARDRSLAGEGDMLIKVASTFTIGDVRGPEMDQGALARLLVEMVWFPTAFLDARHVSWTAVDESQAQAKLRVGGREAAVTFRFGPDGLPSGFTADRYRDVGGRGVLTPWTGECADYRDVGGLRVPFRNEVSWVVDGKAQPDARWALDEIEYDRGDVY